MFRFTIRDLLWLTTFAAAGAAWWLDRSSLSERITRAENAMDGIRFLDESFHNWPEDTRCYLQAEKMFPPLTESGITVEN